MQTIQGFETTSISLAAFLLAKKRQLLSIRKDYPKSYFVFEKTPNLEDFVKEFESLCSSVEPQQYFSSLRLLRRSLYSSG